MKPAAIIPSKSAFFALATALVYALFNLRLLEQGQFHEDAYILFIYVENILNGHGIVYYPGGPQAEGATDFLWMLLLVVLGKLGLDVGIAAILLNAIGVFLIVFLLARELASACLPSRVVAIGLYPFAVLWMFSDPLEAAVGGFSVYLYCALVLLAFGCLYREKYILYTPLVSIAIALFRPDGVILGVLYTLIGLGLVLRARRRVKPYLLVCLAAALIGLAYFYWRFHYFGNLLPLPLYVKSSTPGLAGLADNLQWLGDYRFMLIPMVLLAYGRKNLPRLALLAMPVLILFLILTMATQSQNIGYRFQAPLFIVLYYILMLFLIDAASRVPISRLSLFAYVVLITAFVQHAGNSLRQSILTIAEPGYMSHFAVELSAILPAGSRIALTEAGRLAYWNQGGGFEFYDIVGLNTEYPAKNAVSDDYLVSLSPDLLMYHHADLLNVSAYNERPLISVIRLESSDRVLFLPDIDAHSSGVSGQPSPVRGEESSDSKFTGAVLAANDFLVENFDQYDIFLVDYGRKGHFGHVYAIEKTLDPGDALFDLLLASTKKGENLSHYRALKRRVELQRSE